MDWHEEHELVEAAFMESNPAQSGWHRAPCPFCPLTLGKIDKRFSLAINVESWKYRCWRCHAWGKLPGEPTVAVGMNLKVVHEEVIITPPETYSRLTEEPMSSAMCSKDARRYLHRRGVTREIAKECRIGICTDGLQHGRLIVPVIEPETGKWQGWVGRVWHNKPVVLKYVYPRGMKRGELMFNERALFADTEDPIFVMEGVFDALPHFPHAVACLGKPSRIQNQMLLHTSRPNIVALDGDAWQEGQGLALWLKVQGRRSGFIRFDPLTDPGNYSAGDLSTLGERALA